MDRILHEIGENTAVLDDFKKAIKPKHQKKVAIQQKALDDIIYWVRQAIDYLDDEIQALHCAQYVDHPAAIMSGLKSSIKEIE